MKTRTVVVLMLCACFLFYKYIAQLFPSLIGVELMHSYGYNGVMLAIMASSYYYSYTFMQIVAGLIIDRYSVKIPMFLAILIIALMIMVFVSTDNFFLMCLSRVFMGVGASFATILYMKCAADYVAPQHFGIVSSFLATATMLGAACGGTPVAYLLHQCGWQTGLRLLALIGFILAFMVLIFQKTKPSANKHQSILRMTIDNIGKVIVKKDNWLLLLYSGLTFSPIIVMGGLWGVPFLTTKYPITMVDASFVISIMFVAHAIGSPLWALLSAKLNTRKQLMHIANAISILALLGIIYCNTSYTVSLILFFIFGLSVSCFMLCFEICREVNALYIMGLAVAFINSGEGVVGTVLEPFIGYSLEAAKTGSTYTLANYQSALFVLPCCFLLSSIVVGFMQRSSVTVELEEPAQESVGV